MELPLHCSRLLRDLNAQRESGLFCDCQVLVRGQRFSAHRNVLSACSVHFRTLFLSSFPEPLAKSWDDTGVVTATLDNLAPSTFAVILDFMYTARLTLTGLNSEDVMSAAGFLQMSELVFACRGFIGGGLFVGSPSVAATDASDNVAKAPQPSSHKNIAWKGGGQLGFLKHISLKPAFPSETSARRGNQGTAFGAKRDCETPNSNGSVPLHMATHASQLNMIVIDVKNEQVSLEEPQLPVETTNGEAWSSTPRSQPESHDRAQRILGARRRGPRPQASARSDRTGRRMSHRDEGAACIPDDAGFIIMTVPPDGIKQEPEDCSPSNVATFEGDEWESVDSSMEQLSPGPCHNRSLPDLRRRKFRAGNSAREAHVFLGPQDLARNLQSEESALFTKCSGDDLWDAGEQGARSTAGGYPGCRPRDGSAWEQQADLTAAGEKWDGGMALFACNHCPVRFTAKENLVRHQRTVHAGQKLKFCEKCQRNFRDSTDLQRHRLSKHWWQGRDGTCPFCPERFRVSRELLKHIQHCHRGLAAF
ncbi:uncharacterized protein LOC144732158 [Lampetra planeri]